MLWGLSCGVEGEHSVVSGPQAGLSAMSMTGRMSPISNIGRSASSLQPNTRAADPARGATHTPPPRAGRKMRALMAPTRHQGHSARVRAGGEVGRCCGSSVPAVPCFCGSVHAGYFAGSVHGGRIGTGGAVGPRKRFLIVACTLAGALWQVIHARCPAALRCPRAARGVAQDGL